MHTIWQDVRYGARILWKHRLATLVGATALALGIGANTAMFSVAEAFLLHSVPFENPDRIVAMARGEIVLDKPVRETNVEEVSEVL